MRHEVLPQPAPPYTLTLLADRNLQDRASSSLLTTTAEALLAPAAPVVTSPYPVSPDGRSTAAKL